jgi:hypothetical protein
MSMFERINPKNTVLNSVLEIPSSTVLSSERCGGLA